MINTIQVRLLAEQSSRCFRLSHIFPSAWVQSSIFTELEEPTRWTADHYLFLDCLLNGASPWKDGAHAWERQKRCGIRRTPDARWENVIVWKVEEKEAISGRESEWGGGDGGNKGVSRGVMVCFIENELQGWMLRPTFRQFSDSVQDFINPISTGLDRKSGFWRHTATALWGSLSGAWSCVCHLPPQRSRRLFIWCWWWTVMCMCAHKLLCNTVAYRCTRPLSVSTLCWLSTSPRTCQEVKKNRREWRGQRRARVHPPPHLKKKKHRRQQKSGTEFFVICCDLVGVCKET